MDSLWKSYGWLVTTSEGWAILLGSFVFLLILRALGKRVSREEEDENPSNFLDLSFLSTVPEPSGKEHPTDLLESPPFPREIDAIPSIEIVKRYKSAISRLVRESGLAAEDVNQYLLPAVEKLAAAVHLLPASQEDHHSYEGGLFLHSVETAINAVVAARNHIFDADETPKQKYQNKKRWVMAAAIAGLAHDLGKLTRNIRTVDADTHKVRRMDIPMRNWIKYYKVRAYSISWTIEDRSPKSHQVDSFFMLRCLLSDSLVNFLCFEGNPKIYQALRDVLYDMSKGPLGKILQVADTRSASDDQVHRAQLSANNRIIQTSNAGQICRAIQMLLTSGKWTYNKADSKVFVTREGAFLKWDDETVSQISEASRKLAQETKTSYIPRTKAIMFDNLVHGRVLLEKENNHGYIWLICPIVLKNNYISCLRFYNAQHLFGFDMLPTMIEAHVHGKEASTNQREAWRREYGTVPETFSVTVDDLINGERPIDVIEHAISVMKLDDGEKTFEEVLSVINRHSEKKEEAEVPSSKKEDGKKNIPERETREEKAPDSSPSKGKIQIAPITVQNSTGVTENETGDIPASDGPINASEIPEPDENGVVNEEDSTEEEYNEESDPLGGEENPYAEVAAEEGISEDDYSISNNPTEDNLAQARARILSSIQGGVSRETTGKKKQKSEPIPVVEVAPPKTMEQRLKDFIDELKHDVENGGGRLIPKNTIREKNGNYEANLSTFYRIAKESGLDKAALKLMLRNSKLDINFSSAVIYLDLK